ncbi:hypothetical protein [Endozoicomonas lisbonensis]|uniref:Uncharacterized protein n=1 Tax=Endozoicomonas lisbonensis TaxID=3120522 RepID=A0ABV2SNL2_9GAMM
MNYKKNGAVLLALILTLMLIATVVTAPGLLQQSLRSAEEKGKEYHHSSCQVSAGCQLDYPDGSIKLVIKPYTMPVLQPLQVDVLVHGAKPEAVSLEFVGRDMPMGLMPYSLSPQQNSAGRWGNDQWRYQDTAMITFCPVDRNMVWLAKVVVEFDQLIRIMVFELENQ